MRINFTHVNCITRKRYLKNIVLDRISWPQMRYRQIFYGRPSAVDEVMMEAAIYAYIHPILQMYRAWLYSNHVNAAYWIRAVSTSLPEWPLRNSPCYMLFRSGKMYCAPDKIPAIFRLMLVFDNNWWAVNRNGVSSIDGKWNDSNKIISSLLWAISIQILFETNAYTIYSEKSLFFLFLI